MRNILEREMYMQKINILIVEDNEINQLVCFYLLKNKAKELNLKCNFDDVLAEEALVEIIKITRGNFRLIQRLVMQIERIMRLNKINDLRKDVVETAKESLITGTI